jgi:hypothetical protein
VACNLRVAILEVSDVDGMANVARGRIVEEVCRAAAVWMPLVMVRRIFDVEVEMMAQKGRELAEVLSTQQSNIERLRLN